MHILVLDDQPGMAHLLAWSLRREGFSVATVDNPGEVLKVAGNIDVLFIDCSRSGRIAHSLAWSILEAPFSIPELVKKLRVSAG